MANCHSGDQIAKNLINTDIKTCKIEEPQQDNRQNRSNTKFTLVRVAVLYVYRCNFTYHKGAGSVDARDYNRPFI